MSGGRHERFANRLRTMHHAQNLKLLYSAQKAPFGENWNATSIQEQLWAWQRKAMAGRSF